MLVNCHLTFAFSSSPNHVHLLKASKLCSAIANKEMAQKTNLTSSFNNGYIFLRNAS